MRSPLGFWQRLVLAFHGWEFHEKLRPFDQFAARHRDEMDSSFLLVGLGKLELWTADPQVTQETLLRVRDFEVPHVLVYALGQYGHNVLTANGNQWARHRKIVTSVLGERVLNDIFEESICQTHGLLDEVFSPSHGKIDASDTPLLFGMLEKITLHVVHGVSMGLKFSWKDEESRKPEPGYKMTHLESLVMVVKNVLGTGIVPTSILTLWPFWLPGYRKMSTVGHAKVELYRRSKSILDQERSRMTTETNWESATAKIMTKLLQASENGSTSGQYLSEGEMISNLFIFAFAGFDTTATTLSYAMVLLARYPRWQAWLLEEVDSFTFGSDAEPMEYRTIFPKAIRIMAFMLETVRLYPPVPHIRRETTSNQAFQMSTRTIRLPAGTRIFVNSVALHLLPSWRDINRQSDPAFFEPDPKVSDEHASRPSRWLNPQGSAHTFFQPPKGTFVPWAMGPRVCPGQKMAQVEFTAVMLTLLRNHQIGPSPSIGKEQREVERVLDARLHDSQWVSILRMNGVFDPEEGNPLYMRISKRDRTGQVQ